MNKERLKLLLQYIKEEPQDPFNFYALATEYRKEYPEKSLELFSTLCKKFPDYIPTYYQYGTLLEELEHEEEALRILKIGIEKARSQNDELALRELLNAYNSILYD